MQAQKPASARGGKSTSKAAANPGHTETAAAGVVQPMAGEQREQAIRQAAYTLFEARGYVYGHALEDWLEAEAQVERAFAALPSGAGPGQTGH
ncbi:MAG: DUF2934 domain-containing protein [Rubrivivax sp.]|nr:DUF2934 domain-containing protein [Rubrivivax sp.]